MCFMPEREHAISHKCLRESESLAQLVSDTIETETDKLRDRALTEHSAHS